MKRGFGEGSRSGRVAALCSIVFLVAMAATASAASVDECPVRNARVAYVSNDARWTSNLPVTSRTGATVRLTDCSGMGFLTADLVAGGSAIAEDFPGFLCSSAGVTVGVAELPVLAGCATFATEAIYRDASGARNVVTIPELAAPLAEHDTVTFAGIQSEAPRSTFLAIIPAPGGIGTRVSVTVYDHENEVVATETIAVDAFVFYDVPPVRVGNVEVRNVGPGAGVGDDLGTSVDVIAFGGFRESGGPRVIEPSFTRAASAP